jgi:Domain of unknown function (DUF397)
MSDASERLSWRKSRRSGASGCVEVAEEGGEIHIRNSRDADGPRLTVSREAWEDFVKRVRAGDFDPPARTDASGE